MKKKFLTGSLLPVLAGAAVIGSGFSLWYFADTETSQEYTPSTKVTQVVGLGDITNSDDFTIVFDQTAAGRTKLGVESTTEANGIYIDWNGKTNKVASYASVNDNGKGEIDHDGEKIYFVFSASITIENKSTSKLQDYLSITYAGDDVKSSTYAADTESYEIVLNDNVAEFNWEHVTFSYAEDKEPSNYAQYNAFKEIVDNATITVTYKVEVLSK